MSHSTTMRPAGCAALLAAALALAFPAAAQTQGSSGSSPGSSTSSARSAGSKSDASGGKSAGAQQQLARADRKMLEDLIEANAAEVQTGQLALQKAQSPATKEFAQKMVDDHTKALEQARQLAQSKGVEAKDDTDLMHKAMAKAMGALSGENFDREYMKRVGVSDHQHTVKLLQKIQSDAKDPDLKSLAATMLPQVQQHLQMAQQDTQQMNAGSGSKAPRTGAMGNR